MTSKRSKANAPLLTPHALLEACDATAAERLPAVTRGFRPGRGLAEVRRTIRALSKANQRAPFDARLVCLELFKTLMEHEPWDELRHHPLEPLFDAMRVLHSLRVLTSERGRTTVPPIGEAACHLRHGDLKVRGDLFVRGALFVTGSLDVTGAIHAFGDEWSSGTLVVLGDVRAARMNGLGPIAIGGTLSLSQGLSTAYYHDTDSTLVARNIEAPIWFDRGDIAGRIRGRKRIAHALRFQAWIPKRLPDYFEERTRKVEWKEFDAAFYVAARRAAAAAKRKVTPIT